MGKVLEVKGGIDGKSVIIVGRWTMILMGNCCK